MLTLDIKRIYIKEMDKTLLGYLAGILQHKVHYGTHKNRPFMKYRSQESSEDQTIIVLKTFFGGTVSKKRQTQGKKYWEWACYKVDQHIDFIVSLYPYTYTKQDQFALWLERHYKLRPKLNLMITDLANTYGRYLEEERLKKEERTLKEERDKKDEKKVLTSFLPFNTSINEGASKMKEEEKQVVKEEVKRRSVFS